MTLFIMLVHFAFAEIIQGTADFIMYNLDTETKTATAYRYYGGSTCKIAAVLLYKDEEYIVTSIDHDFGYTDEGSRIQILYFPATLLTINDNFKRAYSIKEVHFEDLESLCSISYKYCPNYMNSDKIFIKDIPLGDDLVIPNTVEHIGQYALYNCDFRSITVGNNVKSIGAEAFGNVQKVIVNDLAAWCQIDFSTYPLSKAEGLYLDDVLVTNLIIPNSVTEVKKRAFYGCKSITSVTIPNSVITIEDYAFSGCTSLNALSLGNGVTTIGSSAFSGCTSLSTLAIPNNVTTINSSAFSGCTSLRSLSLGRGVTTIDNSAFSGCTALLTMEVKATLPPMIQSNTFNNVSTTVMLTVPCESQNYYKAAQYWNQFTNWQEAVLSFSAVTEDATKGKVSVTQKPTCDDPTAVIKAVPAGGYRFKEWSDGNTENPRTVWVDEEMDLVAYFAAEGDGVENITLIEGVSIVGNRLCIAGHEEENMNLYSATGAQLYAGQVRDITLPNAGVYLVQIGNAVQKLIVP